MDSCLLFGHKIWMEEDSAWTLMRERKRWKEKKHDLSGFANHSTIFQTVIIPRLRKQDMIELGRCFRLLAFESRHSNDRFYGMLILQSSQADIREVNQRP
ncbi:hypothetical protein ACET3Z_000672 [Daucus carota]